MALWDDMQSVLSQYEDLDAQQQELRRLVDKMPRSLASVSSETRLLAQHIGGEALYRLGELQRAIEWTSPPADAESALWLGHALFDLGRYDEALPELKRAGGLPLHDWLRIKLDELVICCRIHRNPQSVSLGELVQLLVSLRAVGDEGAAPAELFHAFKSVLPADRTLDLQAARELFEEYFAAAGLTGG